jgi:hypothetical protein
VIPKVIPKVIQEVIPTIIQSKRDPQNFIGKKTAGLPTNRKTG